MKFGHLVPADLTSCYSKPFHANLNTEVVPPLTKDPDEAFAYINPAPLPVVFLKLICKLYQNNIKFKFT